MEYSLAGMNLSYQILSILGRRILYDYEQIGDSPGVDIIKLFFILIHAALKSTVVFFCSKMFLANIEFY